jgi:hypothetical protein
VQQELRLSSSVQLSTPESFVNLEMVRRLEAAEILPNVEFIPEHARLHPELGCTMEPIAGGHMFFGGVGSPINHAIGMGLNGPVTRDDFDRFESFYRERKVPAEIVISPYADPSLLGFVHEGRYKITEFNSVLWQKLSANRQFPPPARGITVSLVTPKNSRRWAEILAECFADLAPVAPELFEGFAHLTNALCVQAEIDGKPVGGAAGAAFLEQGIACFFGGATSPAFRRRGVQTAMTYARLQMAADAGCNTAVVMTAPGSGSQRNAERQGFRVAYTKIVMVRDWDEQP